MPYVVGEVRRALAGAADPARAEQMQAYMKSAMPFRGVSSPDRRSALRPVLADFHPVDAAELEEVVHRLWDDAEYREERYAAIEVCRHRGSRPFQNPERLRLYRHMVETGAWWDLVDEIAAHLVGGILHSYRPQVTPVIRSWATHSDLWLRRTAILSQIRHRDDTDTALLADALEANLDDSLHGTEFWIRKAVGWSLRSYAATDPGWVRTFVDGHEGRLSGLSRREALKHLDG